MNIKDIVRFSMYLLLVSILLFGSAYLIQSLTDNIFLSGQYVTLCVFLFLITIFAYTISSVGISRNPEFGVYGILGGITIKMIVSLSFFLFLLYQFPQENKVRLGLNFFCIYFLMSLFEVIVLLRNLRRKIK